jgi:threonine dehydrogenase-like Zn-dependent dehydrogenase
MTATSPVLRDTQYAVQLIVPDALTLNRAKPVHRPGPHQLLVKVEAVGLCFSDLKLLKQFAEHPRKAPVASGIEPGVLEHLPSYVPGSAPTVPGHEVVARIVAVGERVEHHRVGERVLVQADFRTLRTAGSNGAFGYNFEGGLQEYVLFDERVVIERETGQRYLIPVAEHLGASAVALVEPWGCVENAYVNVERRGILPRGRLMVVVDQGRAIRGLFDPHVRAEALPREIVLVSSSLAPLAALGTLATSVWQTSSAAELPEESFDDIVYFGHSAETLELLNGKLGSRGILNIVLAGAAIGRKVSVGVGRLHYGFTRWIGTAGYSAADAYRSIPPTGELRPGDRVCIVGAGGPMGQMHTLRAVCSGIKDIEVVGADIDDGRLEALRRKSEPFARRNGVRLSLVNTKRQELAGPFTYFALMAPMGQLVADAIDRSGPAARINIFAGIPAPIRHELDLDRYIRQGVFMFGTSGSRIEDMQAVLEKVTAGTLDTNASVDAICGMAGAIDGIRAVEGRTLAGKIIVYPALHDLGLVSLADLPTRLPSVAAKLENGLWTPAAEQELLKATAACK